MRRHLDAARAAEDAAADGSAEGWKKAGDIWREEIDELYGILYDAADSIAKAAVINDRTTFYSYVGVCRVMLDQVYTARKGLTEALYSQAPEVGAEILNNLYKNALINSSK